MKKGLKTIIVFLFIGFITFGCAPTLKEHATISDNYSILNTNTFAVNMKCDNVQISDIRPNFVENYCQIIDGNIKLSLQKQNPTWQHSKEKPDIVIEATLEQIHGGNAAARFWIGLGAGRSVTTIHVKILKNNEGVAQRRFNETTTLANIITDTYSNEDAILQDAHLIADKIAEFVYSPAA